MDHELLAGDDGREGEVCNQAQADEGGEGAEGDGVGDDGKGEKTTSHSLHFLPLRNNPASQLSCFDKQPSLFI
jgi:hypothetical protein